MIEVGETGNYQQFIDGLNYIFQLYFDCFRIMCVLSRSVMSNFLWPYGLQPARLLCPWGFSNQEYWSGLPCTPSGDLLNPGIEPKSFSFQADSLPIESPGKPHSEVLKDSGGVIYQMEKSLSYTLDICFVQLVRM